MKKTLTCIICPIGCQLEVELDGEKVTAVTGNTCIGHAMENMDVILEVRKNGVPVDPAPWIRARSEEAL